MKLEMEISDFTGMTPSLWTVDLRYLGNEEKGENGLLPIEVVRMRRNKEQITEIVLGENNQPETVFSYLVRMRRVGISDGDGNRDCHDDHDSLRRNGHDRLGPDHRPIGVFEPVVRG